MKHAELGERFWSKVNTSAPDECWNWTAYAMRSGYGQIWHEGRLWLAHRLIYTKTHGTIPDGLDIDHKCRNRSCVNPAHLHAVTRTLNNQNQSNFRASTPSRIRGVSWCNFTNKWQVKMTVSPGKRIHVGRYKTLSEAEDAAIAYRRSHYPNSLEDQDAEA